jgi:hypothetical protein
MHNIGTAIVLLFILGVAYAIVKAATKPKPVAVQVSQPASAPYAGNELPPKTPEEIAALARTAGAPQ